MPRAIGMGIAPAFPRAGAAAFNPASIANLIAQYDASALALANDASVDSWADASGNGHTLIPGVAPVYKTNIINGKGVVRFNGTTQWLKRTDAAFRPVEWSFFTVHRWSSAIAAFGGVLSCYTSGENNGYLLGLNAASKHGCFHAGDYVEDSAVAVINTPYLISMTFDNGVTSILRKNGAQVGTATRTNTWSTTPDFVLGRFYSNGFAGDVDVDIGEVLVYARTLTSDEVAQVESYLAAKWGITLP